MSIRRFAIPILLLTLAADVIHADDADERFLAGLRGWGLYRLAETYCREQLAQPDLDPARRAKLVIGLSRSLAERAVASPPEKRGPLWREASGVTETFAERFPQSPLVLLVRLQGTMARLAHGELARREAEVAARPQASREEARDELRLAVKQLDALAEEVETRGRQKPSTTEALSPERLASLEKNLRYELARALRDQGQCYPADSADRANALSRAVQLLEPLARLDAFHPLAWKSRLDQVVCYRLLGNGEEARRRLAALLAEGPPPAVAARARAEAIRQALAAGRVSDAVELAAAEGPRGDVANLELARLEAYLAAWRKADAAKDEARAATWQKRATATVERIERTHGPYWSRRAAMLLAGAAGGMAGGGNLAMQIRAAETAFRGGQPDAALAAYDRARQMALEQGDAEQAFTLGYTAAAVEHQRRNHAEAGRRYRELALAHPAHPRAAEAHLMALHHAAGQVQEKKEPLENYLALLEEHLRRWPEGGDADRLRRRLGQLREHEGNWAGAIAAYREVSADNAKYVEVLDAVARCCAALLAARRATGEPTETIAADAAVWFESRILGPGGRIPQRWSPAARRAALHAARLWLDEVSSGYQRAERILAAARDGADEAPDRWKADVDALLVFALAGQGRRDEAARVLDQMASGSPSRLLAVLRGLQHTAAGAEDDARAELARLELGTLALLEPQRDRLSPAEARNLDQIRARALADAGETAKAREAFKALAKRYPRDTGIQEQYAEFLSEGDARVELEAALAQWRRLEKGLKQGSAAWFRAKLAIARLHYRLGNPPKAAKILRLVEVLHPTLGGPEMGARYRALLERCQTAP